MANQITLGATLLFDGGDGTGGQPDDLTGVATGTTDTSTFLQGSTSYTYSASNSQSGMLYDAGTAQNWANSVFYITVNSGVVGLLSYFRIRFCGATVTDYFEVEVGSSSSWPISIQGGWVTFVVDIEEAKLDSGRITGGTEPATSAIRYVGFSQNLTTMPKMADNTWLDTIYRLPQNTAAIIVEGRNSGTDEDWSAADILTQLGTGQMFYYTGPGGSYVLQGPIQFGIDDTTTHGFTATNATWLWQNQDYVPDGFYGINAVGRASGTTNVTFGTKTGTGDDATGAQGLVIQSASTGPRWYMDFDDPDLDSIGLYGCSFQHGGDFQLDDAAVSVISTLFIDCSSATVSNAGDFLKNKVINANTADGVAFLTTDDITDVVFCEFEFSDGHGVELTTPRVASQTSKGNMFTGYGADTTNDAAIYNNTAGAVSIDITNGGTTATYRNGTSASTTIVPEPVTTLITVRDHTGALYLGARVLLIANGSPGELPYEDSVTAVRSTGTVTVTHTAHGLSNGNKVLLKGFDQQEYNGVKTISNVTTNTYDFTVDSPYPAQPTGTATSTAVILDGTTDSSGEISDIRAFNTDQPVLGKIRKATTSPFYKEAPLSGTIDSLNGLTINIKLILDE